MEILESFGVQGNLLLAQIVNFLIIFFVLRKFFYQPIAKMLEDRKKTIAESLENADKIQKNLEESENKTAKLIKEARAESQAIIDEAKKEAKEITATAKAETRVQIDAMMQKAHAQIELDRETMKRELQKETVSLAITIVQKMLSRDLKNAEKDALTKDALGAARSQLQ